MISTVEWGHGILTYQLVHEGPRHARGNDHCGSNEQDSQAAGGNTVKVGHTDIAEWNVQGPETL